MTQSGHGGIVYSITSATTLALVGLGDYAECPVTSLSGGQMQRVALARSLVYRPQLLLLSNLDAKLRIQPRDELRCILKMTGTTGRGLDAAAAQHRRESAHGAARRERAAGRALPQPEGPSRQQ